MAQAAQEFLQEIQRREWEKTENRELGLNKFA